jgi:sugar phosphate isomerase/epimerase
MKPFSNLSDHSSNPPRLQIGQALWGMEKLPFNAPIGWTIEEKITRVKEAGFEHLECWFGSTEQQQQIPPLLREHGLQLSLGHRPTSCGTDAGNR